MKIPVYDFKFFSRPYKIGEISWGKKFKAQKLFELCSWDAAELPKPNCVKPCIPRLLNGNPGHGIAFQNPTNGQVWLAKSVGWFVGTFSECEAYAKAHKGEIVWL